jgi:hypothetical protein
MLIINDFVKIYTRAKNFFKDLPWGRGDQGDGANWSRKDC